MLLILVILLVVVVVLCTCVGGGAYVCFPSLGFAYVRLFIVCIFVSVVDFLDLSFPLGTFCINFNVKDNHAMILRPTDPKIKEELRKECTHLPGKQK